MERLCFGVDDNGGVWIVVASTEERLFRLTAEEEQILRLLMQTISDRMTKDVQDALAYLDHRDSSNVP